MRRLAGAILAATMLPFLGSCLGTVSAERHVYTLAPSPSPRRAPGPGPRIAVEPLKVSPGYETDAMAYRVTDSELRHYVNRRWATEPEQLVADTLVHHLRATGRFAQVRLAHEPAASGLSISGTVVAIEQVDHLDPDRWHARLALDLVVRDAARDRELFEHDFDESRPCRSNDPGEVARVMRQILAEQAERLARRIERAVSPQR